MPIAGSIKHSSPITQSAHSRNKVSSDDDDAPSEIDSPTQYSDYDHPGDYEAEELVQRERNQATQRQIPFDSTSTSVSHRNESPKQAKAFQRVANASRKGGVGKEMLTQVRPIYTLISKHRRREPKSDDVQNRLYLSCSFLWWRHYSLGKCCRRCK